MANFIKILSKEYNPGSIDQHLFAMQYPAPKCVPILCSSKIDPSGYGEAYVNGIPISSGTCVKFAFSALPVLFLPVGEVATDFDQTYKIELRNYRNTNGKKFHDRSFVLRTAKQKNDRVRREADTVAKQVSDEGIVLLENRGILPLDRSKPVALAGEYRYFRISATGASLIKPRWDDTLEAVLSGYASLKTDAENVIFVISRASGEGKDNLAQEGNYYLTAQEKKELLQAKETYKHVILVLSTGYPIEMRWIKSLQLDAILWTGFSGQSGMESLADLLYGKVCPSGCLADTWPLDYNDVPAAHNFVNLKKIDGTYSDDGQAYGAHIFYEEGYMVGYRYFDTFNKEVAYPFGHGLSYTNFGIEAEAEFRETQLEVCINVKNLGRCEGKKSLLVYVEGPRNQACRPRRQLCGFTKTTLLTPNQEEQLRLTIPAKDFAVYMNERQVFVLEKGNYRVYVGGSYCEAQMIAAFAIAEECIIEKTIRVCEPIEPVGLMETENRCKARSEIIEIGKLARKKTTVPSAIPAELHPYRGKHLRLQDVKADPSRLDDFVAQMSIRELVSMAVCHGTCFQPWSSGAAGKLMKSKRYGIQRIYMSDGNCSVNLYKSTTGFPSSNLLAGTFNQHLAYQTGTMLAKESLENQILVNLGPGGNLHRNFLCGRHSEYFSEDPILAGTMMAEQARGLEEHGVCATYKHLFGNNAEFERKSNQSMIAEGPMRELYLRVFDKAFSLYRPSCLMTSYNGVNGRYPSEDPDLLQKLVREQWGFDGMIMTDWGACDTADCVASINAGTNLITQGDKKTYRRILHAAKNGTIPKAVLQASAKQVLKVMLKCFTP